MIIENPGRNNVVWMLLHNTCARYCDDVTGNWVFTRKIPNGKQHSLTDFVAVIMFKIIYGTAMLQA